MKLTKKLRGGKEETVIVKWSDHYPACKACREVDLDKSATLALACPMGSVLAKEELQKRAVPAVKEKERKVREWARKAGTFHEVDHRVSRDLLQGITKYK